MCNRAANVADAITTFYDAAAFKALLAPHGIAVVPVAGGDQAEGVCVDNHTLPDKATAVHDAIVVRGDKVWESHVPCQMLAGVWLKHCAFHRKRCRKERCNVYMCMCVCACSPCRQGRSSSKSKA